MPISIPKREINTIVVHCADSPNGRSVKRSSILSINDHPDMCKIFKGFKMETVDISNTIGGAGQGAKRRELIYRNW